MVVAFTLPKYTTLFEAVELKPDPSIVTDAPTFAVNGAKELTIGCPKEYNEVSKKPKVEHTLACKL